METIRGYNFISIIAILLVIFISSCKTKSDITTVNKAISVIKKREYVKLREMYFLKELYDDDLFLKQNIDTASLYLNTKDCEIKIFNGKKFHSTASNVYGVDIISHKEIKCRLVFLVSKANFQKLSSIAYCYKGRYCIE